MIDILLRMVKWPDMPNVIHTLVPVEKPVIKLKRNTVRRTRQLDGRLVHQFLAVDGYGVFNTDGERWWKVVTAVKNREGHVHVFA